jgi:glucose-6-phosphate isomerase
MILENVPEWQMLLQRHAEFGATTLSQLFAADAERAARLTFKAAGLTVDLSRQFVDESVLQAFAAWADGAGLAAWRDRLFAGAAVNDSENRPAWHTALRSGTGDAARDAELRAERERMLDFATALRDGQIRGATGVPIEDVLSIGIGGSDLGPRLAVDALGPASGAARLHFVTNIDPVELDQALASAKPESTLIITISKSFSTLETRENSLAAQAWMRSRAPKLDVARHTYAVTSQPDRAAEFGIPAAQTLTFPDWVGGRYSIWSACGLPVAITHGRAQFEQLLAGAAAMDSHFCDAEPARNLPLLLGALGAWYGNAWGFRTRAIFAYAQRLQRLPAYLQQLEMESLGKRVDRQGNPVAYDTSPVVWGDAGTTAQHSMFQFLHQGTRPTPIDFVTSATFAASPDRREQLLYMNAVAQADALAFGDRVLGETGEKPPYAVAPGNRPSSLITLDRIDAAALGALIAMYEHRVFVQGVLWNVNPFDQWGVEIGKKLLAKRLKGK